MSGEMAVRGAVIAALRNDADLMALVNLVSNGEPIKASPPWLLVGETVSTGWGARDVTGLALRLPIQLVVRGDDLARVTAVLARVDAVLAGVDGDLGDWRITSLRFERSRILRSRTEWRASADYAVRAARLN
ncbi:hypothetical protein M2336_003405 [Sphingobium sp. B1D7B]|nr:hypothetical protein [Sphingobium sp. B1D7B]